MKRPTNQIWRWYHEPFQSVRSKKSQNLSLGKNLSLGQSFLAAEFFLVIDILLKLQQHILNLLQV